ncbi:unnamed protein product [Larinioides sclopetarius]|uniref:Uncharacterized protein n=1 Tax=Larinioides sclopetarius TaxID=280406 RepID=A0AAV1Z3Y1_9ARAC
MIKNGNKKSTAIFRDDDASTSSFKNAMGSIKTIETISFAKRIVKNFQRT